MVVEDVETLKRELPALLRDDLDLRRYILELTRGESAGRQQTEDRFDRILEELRQDREANTRKWEEQDRKWWKAQEENKRKWEEQDRKWREAREEEDRKWEENRADFKRVHEEIMAQAEKYDRRIGALGARWGMQSEASFRNALGRDIGKELRYTGTQRQ